ncbi:MAG: tetratricopeptide repeat protein [Candidatus Korobacteraceae bacterium]|jgi:hypothetical protein
MSTRFTKAALLGIALVAATVAVYWPVHTHSFVPDDDYFIIVDNMHIHQGLGLPTVKWAFTAMNMVNWVPVTWLSHAADYQIFGLNPAGHHDMNVVFHCLSAVLLFWMLQRATGFAGRSVMVAALFALHPMNVEAVAWVAERKTMLSMIFLVLALAAYRWYACRPGIGRYSVVALLYWLGLMAKSQVIMLPFLLLLWDYWPLQRMLPTGRGFVEGTNSFAPLPGRSFRFLVLEKIPLFVLALIDAAITLYVQHAGHPEQWPYPLRVRLDNAVVAYARYVGKALCPAWLAMRYPHPGNSLPLWQIIGAVALLLSITGFVLYARRFRYLTVGWLWFLISMIPMSGIVHFGDQAMADRYAYQPFCGLFLLICWGVAEWAELRHVPAMVLASVSVIVLAVLGTLTYRQVQLWGDDLALWSHALQVTSNNVFAEDRVGEDLQDEGKRSEAMQHFRRAVAIDPSDIYGNLQLAFYEHQRGNLHGAIAYYEAVIRSPESAAPGWKRRALANLGHAYGTLGDVDRARQCFLEATKLPEAHESHWVYSQGH